MRILFVDLGSLLCDPDTNVMKEENIHRFFSMLNRPLSVINNNNEEKNSVYVPLISFEYVPEHVTEKYSGPDIIYRRPFNKELMLEWENRGYNLHMFPPYYNIFQWEFTAPYELYNFRDKVYNILEYMEEQPEDVSSYAILIPEKYVKDFVFKELERVITFKDSNDCTDDLVIRVQNVLYNDL